MDANRVQADQRSETRGRRSARLFPVDIPSLQPTPITSGEKAAELQEKGTFLGRFSLISKVTRLFPVKCSRTGKTAARVPPWCSMAPGRSLSPVAGQIRAKDAGNAFAGGDVHEVEGELDARAGVALM